MSNILTEPFKESTIVWLLISGVIGGIIGAAIKTFFEEIISPGIRDRRAIKKIVAKYSLPIIRSADSLQNRIFNLLSNVKHIKFNISEDEEYRLSTYYIFAQFLGWVRIVEQEVCYLDFESSKKTRLFNTRLYSVFKGFTSTFYFTEDDQQDTKIFTVHRNVLSAIGDVVVIGEGGAKLVMGYAEFVTKLESNKEFSRWFKSLEEFLTNLKAEAVDTRWDRLIIIYAQLNALRWFLDPSSKRGKKPRFDLHYLTNQYALTKIKDELSKSEIPGEIIRWPKGKEYDK